MKAILLVSAAVLALGAPALGQNVPWHGYGGDAQHNAQAPATGQSLSNVHWSIPVDLAPPGFLGIHYAEPMITAGNTVLVPIKVNSQGAYRMEAHSAADGSIIWKDTVTYRFPPYDWIPSIPAHLTEQSRLYFAGIRRYCPLPRCAGSGFRRRRVRRLLRQEELQAEQKRLRQQRHGEHAHHGGCQRQHLFRLHRYWLHAARAEERHCAHRCGW